MSGQIGPLESRWTLADGIRMHARVSVDSAPAGRPSIVLVHGQVVSSRYMIPTAERLASEFPVAAPDLPGFGHTERPPHVLSIGQLADSLAAWMEASGLDRAVLVGNSMGCQIIVEFAIRYPSRVSKAVLQGPTADPAARTAPRQIARWLLNSIREPPSLGAILLIDYLQAGKRRALRTFLQDLLRDPIEEKLPHVQAPTLVVRGSRDPIVPQRWAEEATRLLPCGRLVVIPGAAHTINYSAPREFVRVIRVFLDEDPDLLIHGRPKAEPNS
jgi:2-hydroxy-6-oxonona-2,4-dienedioate hydrolase